MIIIQQGINTKERINMTRLLRLEKGNEDALMGENSEIINGVAYEKPELDEAHKDIVRYLHAASSRYVLTHRPLDKLAMPHDPLVIDSEVLPNTILRPEIAMQIKDESFPAWVVEIASEENMEVAYLEKMNIYMAAGVKEYWVIDPVKQVILSYNFVKNPWIPAIYDSPQRIKVSVYKDYFISYSEIFKNRSEEE